MELLVTATSTTVYGQILEAYRLKRKSLIRTTAISNTTRYILTHYRCRTRQITTLMIHNTW